jgi:hypothetical protein
MTVNLVDPPEATLDQPTDGYSTAVQCGRMTTPLPAAIMKRPIVSCIHVGEVDFYRVAGSTSGLIAENTGRAIPAGMPLEATFVLGNTDTVRKRMPYWSTTPTSAIGSPATSGCSRTSRCSPTWCTARRRTPGAA